MPVRLGLGAILGDGKQWTSWIHIDDLVRLFEFALDTPMLRGALNAVSPRAATHAQLQRMMATVLHRPMWMRIPAFVVRTLLGEMSQLLVDGQHVIPTRATAAGFDFKHPGLGEALKDLLGAQLPREAARAEIYYDSEWARRLNVRKRRLNPFRA
jgi:NAD dependent epimerase/dehydratase family enzyme